MATLRRYALLAHAGGAFCERHEASADREAVADFLRRDRAGSTLGPWNADLWSVDDFEVLVCVRADSAQSWLNEWERKRARARWLYVRDGQQWRAAHVCLDDLGLLQRSGVPA